MKVTPDFPVPDDKVSDSKDDFPVKSDEDDFSVSVETMGGGKVYALKGQGTTPYEPHECALPTFRNNDPFQYMYEYKVDLKRIPEGAFWRCDTCENVYEAQSRNYSSGMKRYWVLMKWHSFAMQARWAKVVKAV
jgi:hypothetical protein